MNVAVWNLHFKTVHKPGTGSQKNHVSDQKCLLRSKQWRCGPVLVCTSSVTVDDRTQQVVPRDSAEFPLNLISFPDKMNLAVCRQNMDRTAEGLQTANNSIKIWCVIIMDATPSAEREWRGTVRAVVQ